MRKRRVKNTLKRKPDADDVLALGGPYEGAERFSNTVAFWSPMSKSADGDLLPEKGLLDSRSKDIVRNDGYVQAGVDLNKDNIVGSAFLLNSKPNFKILGLDSSWAEEFQEEVESKFTLYAESPNNWVDASRKNTLTELVRLAVSVHTMGGEVLASAEWLKSSNRPYKTAIQMIDCDRLCNPNWGMDQQFLRGGFTLNRYGEAITAHILKAHPNDFVSNGDNYIWDNIPVRKPWGRLQIIHIFEQMRPSQSRGVSAMVAALKEMKITKKYRDIVLQNAVVNATYAASLESDLPSEAAYETLGGGNVNPFVNYASQYLAAVSEYCGNSKSLKIDGVKIPHLFPGTKFQLRNAGQPGGIGTGFESSLLRYISAALGVSYEELSRDYSQTNYSSARAAMNNTWKHMQSTKKTVADKFASHVYRLWLEEAINFDRIESLPKKAKLTWYDNPEFADALSECEWIGGSRGQIDEFKETQAAVLRIKYNLTTVEDELSKLGKDWRKVFTQRKYENDMMEQLGLVDENSNAINAASGKPQIREYDGEPRKGIDDDKD